MRAALIGCSVLLIATAAFADDAPKTSAGTQALTGTASAAKPAPAEASIAASASNAAQPAGSFSVEMHMVANGEEMTMKRTVDGPKTRMDISGKGMNQTIIMLGDEKKTMYTIDTAGKRAMKMSQTAMMGRMGSHAPAAPAPSEGGEAVAPQAAQQGQVKLVGQESIDGRQTNKYEIDYGDKGMGTMWMDAENNLPVRMQSGTSTIDFKNYKFGPQPAEQFEIPKDYKVTDVDAEMAKMPKNMMSGMAQGMAGGMMGGMGGSLGGGLGGSLGGMLGGPLGSMVGQYVGQKIGQKLGSSVGQKAAGAVTGH